MSSELLRRAASRIKEAAQAADLSAHTFWPDPWKVEASVARDGSEPLDIVSQGDTWRGAVQYIADAETPAYAAWIAMMSTHLADPLAKMLEAEADGLDSIHQAADHVWKESTPQNDRDRAKFLDEAMPKFTHSIALARVILAEEES